MESLFKKLKYKKGENYFYKIYCGEEIRFYIFNDKIYSWHIEINENDRFITTTQRLNNLYFALQEMNKDAKLLKQYIYNVIW